MRRRRPGRTRRGAAGRRVVRRGQLRRAAAALGRPTQHPDGLANSSGLVGRRYMAHLATMMQGFHPFRVNDTVFQKTVAINDFYLRGPGRPYPLGQIQSQGRTHGVMAQVVGDTMVPGIPLLGLRLVGRARRGLAGDVRGPAAPRQPGDGRRRRTDPAAVRGPTTSRRTRSWSREATRILRRLGFWKVMTHSHQNKNTTHQCGTLVLRHRSAAVGARPVLPHPRRREPLRRRRVVLPVVGRGEPRPDDRRAGPARGRPHHSPRSCGKLTAETP